MFEYVRIRTYASDDQLISVNWGPALVALVLGGCDEHSGGI